MSKENKLPLVIIVGPTAAGKTAVSINLAKTFNGEIVSADSRLFYRGMDIGTAKPTEDEMEDIPHHLIDVANPDEVWSLGIYQREAHRVIDEIHKRGKLPFLVGGTGQYIRSIVEGWRIPTQSPDNDLRHALTHWADEIGPEGLHKRLDVLDTAAARKIDYRNLRRTVRALEVILKTGKRFSDQRTQQSCRYRHLILGIDHSRESLYARIDARIEQMLEQGLVEEVKGLLNAGYTQDLPTMSAIGYGEIIQYLQGEISLDEAIALIKRNTRIFVRRQANWFKRGDERIQWFSSTAGMINYMEQYIRRNLDEG